jgi:hypothetical protein
VTTEAGIPTIKQASHYVATVRRRLAFIEDRLERGLDHNIGSSYDLAEVTALEWALPVLEAELDWIRRAAPLYVHDPRNADQGAGCPVCGALPSDWFRGRRWVRSQEESPDG